MLNSISRRAALVLATACLLPAGFAQIGTRFPSEKKVIPDPVTGVPLSFLTSVAKGDSKIYQTHHQWTADGKWLVFRSNRVRGEAMAVNEQTGVIVQVSEGGYSGMLCLADNSMSLYFLRIPMERPAPPMTGAEPSVPATPPVAGAAGARPPGGPGGPGGRGRPTGPAQIMRVDLAKLFADSEAGKLQPASAYEKACGTIPMEWGAGGDMALDCTEDYAYFRVGKEEAAKHLPADTKMEPAFGPRNMGAGPTGLGIVNLRTREMRIVGQIPMGNAGRSVWHVGGSPDGRWAVADDFQYRLWLYDLTNGDSILLADMGHMTTATDHIHPTFSADSTKIEIQSAMLAEDKRTLNICVVPVPEAWLKRTYPTKIVP